LPYALRNGGLGDFLRTALIHKKERDSLTGVCVKLAGAMQSIKYFCPKSLSKIRPCPQPRREIQKLSACNGQGGKVPRSRVAFGRKSLLHCGLGQEASPPLTFLQLGGLAFLVSSELL